MYGVGREEVGVKKRRNSDVIRERNAHKRELAALDHPPYKSNPYATKAILGRHFVEILVLNAFNQHGRKKLYELLRQLRAIPLQSKVTLDFSNLAGFKISALLILYAHLEIFLQGRNRNHISWKRPLDLVEDSKLAELGLWALLGEEYRPVAGAIRICSVSHLEKQKNECQPLREAITYAQAAIASYKGEDDEGGNYAFNAVSESFSNVWQHAYSLEARLPEVVSLKKWWIAIEKVNDQLFMAVYDVGIGIPRSTRKKSWYTSLKADLLGYFGGLNGDCQDLKTALEYGVSRYNLQGRGNGLPAIKELVEVNPDGDLYIVSGKGIYRYRSKFKREEWASLESAFPGTLIQWNLALSENGNRSDE